MTLRSRTPREVPIRRRGGAGAGLIGLMVVLLIGLLIYTASTGGGGGTGGSGAGGGGNYTQQLGATRKQSLEVRQDITTGQLVILLAAYRQENGRLPKSPADLESPGAFNDPWGQEMTFSFKEGPAGTIVTFKSPGRDGQFGTEDDVTRDDVLPY